MNTENLKNKAKDAWNKVTSDKTTTEKIKTDVKNKDFSGAAETAKEKLQDLKTDSNKAA